MAPVDKPCCLGTVKQGELKGKNVELGPLTTYIIGSEKEGGSAVLCIPDIFGFSIPNTRLQNGFTVESAFANLLHTISLNEMLRRLFADQLAQQGFFVLLPDIFHGDSWDNSKELAPNGDWSVFTEWRMKHPQGPQMLQLDRLLTDMHQQYKPKTVSCIGFCWGGHHSTALAGTDKVSAAIVAHGSFVTKELVQAAHQPIQFLFADNVRHSVPSCHAAAGTADLK